MEKFLWKVSQQISSVHWFAMVKMVPFFRNRSWRATQILNEFLGMWFNGVRMFELQCTYAKSFKWGFYFVTLFNFLLLFSDYNTRVHLDSIQVRKYPLVAFLYRGERGGGCWDGSVICPSVEIARRTEDSFFLLVLDRVTVEENVMGRCLWEYQYTWRRHLWWAEGR